MNHPKRLVELYRAFYRADKMYNPSARKSIQPLFLANEVICTSISTMRDPDFLRDAVAGRIAKLMAQIRGGGDALGRWVCSSRSEEREAILAFADYLVSEVFYNSFSGDIGKYSGKQRGYLEDTCEFIYRSLQDQENKEKETVSK